MSEIFIYALVDPNNQNDIRYIGKSKTPKERFYAHKHKTFRSKTNNGKWIYELRQSGLFPKMIILDSVPIEEEFFWEQFYIDLLRTWGFNLNNHTISSSTKLYCHSKQSIELMRDVRLSFLGINKEEYSKKLLKLKDRRSSKKEKRRR